MDTRRLDSVDLLEEFTAIAGAQLQALDGSTRSWLLSACSWAISNSEDGAWKSPEESNTRWLYLLRKTEPSTQVELVEKMIECLKRMGQLPQNQFLYSVRAIGKSIAARQFGI